jgi:hypothetical protein
MRVDNLAQQARQCDEEVEQLKQRAIELKAKATRYRAEANEILRIAGDEMIEPINTDILISQLQDAEDTNRKVLANQRRRELEKQMRAKNMEVEQLTIALEGIAEEKENRLAQAKFPVPGLSFSDDGVLLNGLPFDQGSSAEQLRVCVAMGLAMHPKLRVLLIRDGSLLDKQSLALLEQMVEESDAQVFVERVSKGAECSVIISDGQVQEAEERQVA